jgi:hypothetical protein
MICAFWLSNSATKAHSMHDVICITITPDTRVALCLPYRKEAEPRINKGRLEVMKDIGV